MTFGSSHQKVREMGGILQFDLLPVSCQTSLVKGQSKGKSCNSDMQNIGTQGVQELLF